MNPSHGETLAIAPVYPYACLSMFPGERSLEAYDGEFDTVVTERERRSGLGTSARSSKLESLSRKSGLNARTPASWSDLAHSVKCN